MIDILKANTNHSVSWKKNSRDLLINSRNLSEFKEAARWCGTNGNVSRTVATEDFNEFAEYIFNSKDDILEGKFDLGKMQSFGGKKPTSWVSKICHIINPQKYPLIYDKNVRKHFHIFSIEQFQKLLVSKRNESASKSNEEIYKEDSRIWAKNI